MNIKEIKPKQWKELREDLKERLRGTRYESVMLSNMKRMSPTRLALEGGPLPLIVNVYTHEVKVWSRGNRYSGAEISIDELSEVEFEIDSWIFVNHIALRGETQ